MKDLKYIIKRIIIGTGIALAVMFMKQNVFAYEWTTEGDVQLSTIDNPITIYRFYNNSYSSSSPSFPFTASGNNDTVTFPRTAESGSTNGSFYNVSPAGSYYVTGLTLYFNGFVFEPNINYYIVYPIAYNPDYSSLSYNNDVLLDSSSYSSSSNYVTISSASYSTGSLNDVEVSSAYPNIMYFKIFFSTSEEINNLMLYINTDGIGTNNRKSITYSSYNTTSFNDYLYRYNNGCTSYSSCSPLRYYTRSYKPFVYTWAGSITPAPADGNDIASDVSSDIKTQIQDIIDGQFTDDLNFPYLNGGGRTFGDNTYTLQDLLIMPLNFVQKLTSSDTCSPLTVPVPGLNATMQLPCLSTFASSMLGQQIVDMIKLIVGCILGFKILTALYNSILHIFDPQHLLWVDDIF